MEKEGTLLICGVICTPAFLLCQIFHEGCATGTTGIDESGATGPAGLNRSLLNRSPYNDASRQWIDRELLYAGREGDVLHITYREYSVMGHARAPFFQQVYYDLKTSDAVVFQDWVLQVLDANNQRIRFKVIKEPSRSWKSLHLYPPAK